MMLVNPYAASAVGGGGDSSFASVVALLHFDNNLSDVKGHTFTATGSAAASNTQSKFGSYSLEIPGAGTDYLSSATSSDWGVGSADFTLEAWIYRKANSLNNTICARWQSPRQFLWLINGGGALLNFSWNQGGSIKSTNYTLDHNTANVWDFFSLSRVGSNLYAHQNGTALAYASGDVLGANSIDSTSSPFYLGINDNGIVSGLFGFMDDFRFTNGVGRYSGSGYTSPAAAFPDS